MDWIWERVLVAEFSDLREPGVLDGVMQDINPVLVKDAGRAKKGNHV